MTMFPEMLIHFPSKEYNRTDLDRSCLKLVLVPTFFVCIAFTVWVKNSKMAITTDFHFSLERSFYDPFSSP